MRDENVMLHGARLTLNRDAHGYLVGLEAVRVKK